MCLLCEDLAEAMILAGTNLYELSVPKLSGSGTKTISLMYLVPAQLTLPDLSLPSINDMRMKLSFFN